MKTTISLAQINLVLGDVKANFSQAADMLGEAAKQGSQIFLLPELWSSGFDLKNREKYHDDNRRLLPELFHLARRYKIWIGGSWIEKSKDRFYNTFNLISPQGVVTSSYSKVHLFRLMDESQWLNAGNQLTISNMPWGKAGLAICYDLRFPELFRRFGVFGVPITLIVAQWPIRRISHWSTLLRARAIENQMFVAGVNCVGQIGEETYGGKSAIINPWGEALTEGTDADPALLTAEIDFEEIEHIRNWMPVFSDRRPDLYG